ncbi:MAG TPA: monovalent cation/H(+) antiporter subunit G [Acidimicrobiales bacterium]|nr:monovalent cation/H(+) antiporter subunit G [Acidimicrobiales bacterium]
MIGEALALAGSVIVLLAAIGVVRFSDVFSRMHALAKGSTLGILLLFTGAAVNLGDIESVTTVVLAAVLHIVTLPPGSNLVSRAAHRAGLQNGGDAGVPGPTPPSE